MVKGNRNGLYTQLTAIETLGKLFTWFLLLYCLNKMSVNYYMINIQKPHFYTITYVLKFYNFFQNLAGPTCSISCSQLQMACPSDQRKVCRQFSLNNEGQCENNFQFTVEGHPLITMQPNHGRIPASTSINIIITYTPVDKRKYFKRIFCLVANHVSLVVVITVFNKKKYIIA